MSNEELMNLSTWKTMKKVQMFDEQVLLLTDALKREAEAVIDFDPQRALRCCELAKHLGAEWPDEDFSEFMEATKEPPHVEFEFDENE